METQAQCPFKAGEYYETLASGIAIVYAVLPEQRDIHGAILDNNNKWSCFTWNLDGTVCGGRVADGRNLVAANRRRWINIYGRKPGSVKQDEQVFMFKTRAAAIADAEGISNLVKLAVAKPMWLEKE